MNRILLRARIAVVLLAFSTITSAFAVDRETVTTVADKGTSGMYIAKLWPDHDIAIDSEGEVVTAFCVYTDGSNVRVLRLRLQGGKYIVKAGDCVIVKTNEARTIPLEETTASMSSVWMSHIICPTEDTVVADFCASRPVKDNEYIYMLTNMERNGGFGFTHFTGTTMKKGNFYIVSTHVPETTGIESVSDNPTTYAPLYNLEGKRVDTPTVGQICIRNGRKFIYRGDEGQASLSESVMTRAVNDIEDGDPVPFLSGEAGDDDGL